MKYYAVIKKRIICIYERFFTSETASLQEWVYTINPLQKIVYINSKENVWFRLKNNSIPP